MADRLAAVVSLAERRHGAAGWPWLPWPFWLGVVVWCVLLKGIAREARYG